MDLKRVLNFMKGNFHAVLRIMLEFAVSSSTSVHNQEVKQKLVQEIKDVPDVGYTEEEIRGTINVVNNFFKLFCLHFSCYSEEI